MFSGIDFEKVTINGFIAQQPRWGAHNPKIVHFSPFTNRAILPLTNYGSAACKIWSSIRIA